MNTPQNIQEQLVKSEQKPETVDSAGIFWAPKLWQRVEVLLRYRLAGTSGLGTLVAIKPEGYAILLDGFQYPAVFIYSAQFVAAPAPAPGETAFGWVPLSIYKQYLVDWENPQALDLKLTNGRRAFNAWPKKMPPDFYTFNEMDRPHGRYTEHHVDAVRPAEEI